MNPEILLVGNWKMNTSLEQGKALVHALRARAAGLRRTALWFAPPSPWLLPLGELAHGSEIVMGSQNVHWEESGAFTGEVSLLMLRECRAQFSIVGHSERRGIFSETDTLCAARAVGALMHGFGVIFCVGETLVEREAGETNRVIERQLSALTRQLVDVRDFPALIIAYEPVWAIGTGKAASIQDIESAHRFIADQTAHLKPAVRILYGGSVSPQNFSDICACPLVGGALVGKVSLQADSFLALADIAENTTR